MRSGASTTSNSVSCSQSISKTAFTNSNSNSSNSSSNNQVVTQFGQMQMQRRAKCSTTIQINSQEHLAIISSRHLPPIGIKLC